MPTTQLAAKLKIVAVLQAAEDLAGIQVSFGHPGKHIEDELVVVGPIKANTESATLGARKRDEDYTIRCAVSVIQKGDDQEWTTSRAYEIYNVVEAVLQDNPKLDELEGLLWALVTGAGDLNEGFTDGGRVADLSFGIQCKARI